MPITCHVDRHAKIVHFVAEGELTTAEMLAAIDRAIDAAGDDAGWSVLSDHLGLRVPATGAQVRAMLDHIGHHGQALHGARMAVVTVNPASYGMMRMMGTLGEAVPIEVRIFAGKNEALQWLQEAR